MSINCRGLVGFFLAHDYFGINFSYGQKEKQIPVLASWKELKLTEFLFGGEYLCLLEGKKLMLWQITPAIVIYDYKF